MPKYIFTVWRSRRGSAMELRALMSLDAALESMDPFNNSAAREHWRHVRSIRGW